MIIDILSPILKLKRPELYQLFEGNELCFAVLHHCESDVVRILRKDRSLLRESTYRGLTPFHLAVSWPRGLSILIAHGANEVQSIISIRDSLNVSALEYAIITGETTSVKILLDSEIIISEETLRSLGILTDQKLAHEIMGLMAKTLFRRQRSLLELALRTLSAEDVQNLGLHKDVILDEKAFHVVRALKERGISVPAVYDAIVRGSVYHWPFLTTPWAQALFDAGFVETNSLVLGLTPLMGISENFWTVEFNQMLGLIHWFYDHGANLYTSISYSSKCCCCDRRDVFVQVRPTVHYFAESLGWVAVNVLVQRERLETSNRNLSLFSKLLSSKVTDPCECYCAANGCTPTSKFVCGIYTRILLRGGDIERHVINCIRSIESAKFDESKYDVIFDFIRAVTFERLGMRHTCCRYTMRTAPSELCRHRVPDLMELSEVKEIREEDRNLAGLLNLLVEEFERAFLDLDVPLSQFVKQHLWPRVDKVMEEQDEVSSENLHAMREIGVVLDGS
ncbi:hypothetical protein F5B20DRAFT_92864 [Whalleya microplaca]|nr:hypothetical protein F5B20DRAFT_92864 [Whalleya microplaca]